jgi:glyoxylase-like metal-dependent hydrolase (beta-lactamase superfamily II)
MFETNCYLAYDKGAGEGVIIDPGDEADRIISEVNQIGFKPKMILLTHGHGDHIGAVETVKNKFNIPLLVGTGEEKLLTSAAQNFSAAYGTPISCPPADRTLNEGESVEFGSESLKVITTPGHSPGGICYHSNGILFCGDTLFYGSIGRTDFPGCSHEQLIKSIMDKLLILPDATVCYPGHGPSTTIGQERLSNPYLSGNPIV